MSPKWLKIAALFSPHAQTKRPVAAGAETVREIGGGQTLVNRPRPRADTRRGLERPAKARVLLTLSPRSHPIRPLPSADNWATSPPATVADGSAPELRIVA